MHEGHHSFISLSCVSPCIIVSFLYFVIILHLSCFFPTLSPHMSWGCWTLSSFLDEASTILDMSGTQPQNNSHWLSCYFLWCFILFAFASLCLFILFIFLGPLYSPHAKIPSLAFSHVHICHISLYMIHGFLMKNQPLGSQYQYQVSWKSFPWDWS